MDNLESQTYEVFEKDPVKYNQYQEVRLCNISSVCARIAIVKILKLYLLIGSFFVVKKCDVFVL